MWFQGVRAAPGSQEQVQQNLGTGPAPPPALLPGGAGGGGRKRKAWALLSALMTLSGGGRQTAILLIPNHHQLAPVVSFLSKRKAEPVFGEEASSDRTPRLTDTAPPSVTDGVGFPCSRPEDTPERPGHPGRVGSCQALLPGRGVC